MRVLIIGGGLIGLSTAHFLAKEGAAITLVDAGPRPATGASYANGGLITPSMSDPWNAPGVTWKLLRWIGRPDAPLLLRARGLRSAPGWMARFLRSSSHAAHRRNTLSNLRLGAYSIDQMQQLRRETRIDYGGGALGTLKVFRSRASFEAAQVLAELVQTQSLEVRTLDRAGTVATEPALAAVAASIVGGQYFPGDETGDARLFCELLAQYLTERGCDLRYGVAVEALQRQGNVLTGALTSAGVIKADAYVLAGGAQSGRLARPLGLKLHVQPVKGYSISVPMGSWAPVPAIGIVDDDLHAAATPIGNVLRVVGTAEFAGFDDSIGVNRIRNLQRLAVALYPHAAAAIHGPDIRPWAGLRPMSADGVPVIGRTPIDKLFVNTGHGHLGWTLAAGSGRLLADLMLRDRTDIDASAYGYERPH